MVRGDSKTWSVPVTCTSGLPRDLTGLAFAFIAKDRLSDDPAAAVITRTTANSGVVTTNALLGKAEVRLVAADTSGFSADRTLYWRLVMTDASGPDTLEYGTLRVVAR